MKRIQKILLLGSGALKIGEAGEFDYSGTQAIKALKEESKEVILINPNIATIQTSEGLADRVYFLPVTPEFVSRVIAKEHPDSILLSFGGQTALNCGIALYNQGILKKYGVEILGTPITAVIDTEDRVLFSRRLNGIGLKTAQGKSVRSVEEGLEIAGQFGYPVMIRTGFALGGTGSGIAVDRTMLKKLLTNAFATASQVIIEESLHGWKEIEYEVVRDRQDNCITVCNMENFDPVGIHTGESIVIAPAQTLTDREYYGLRDIAIRTIRELGIVGECNIQYAVDPTNGHWRIIEVNARLSRSSALASKATGYPLAYVAAKLAIGRTLPELRNCVTRKTSAFFEPSLDYVVVKIPRWDLGKYTNVDMSIGSEMKSVGEVMSIARTFKEAIQKAVRMLGQGYQGVIDESEMKYSLRELKKRLQRPDAQRLFTIGAALYKGMKVLEVANVTGIDPWFLESIRRIVETYKKLKKRQPLTAQMMTEAKRQGFSDRQIGEFTGMLEDKIRSTRVKMGVLPKVKRVDTMAGEFPAQTNYLYLTYAASTSDHAAIAGEEKVIVLGSGPYSIGTSVEFDWCAVNTVMSLRDNGKKTVIVNCNPETVSTDFDFTDYLYFEELTLERVLDIYDIEQSPFIVSVGGQIPNNLAPKLDALHIPILGSDAKTILKAEDRQVFSALLDRLHIRQPLWSQDMMDVKKIGFPMLLRPSFVLSGKAMLVIETEEQLAAYLDELGSKAKEYSLVMTKFMQNATECDVDGVAQNGKILISAVSEHVEKGGVHSGDATLVLPPYTLTSDEIQRIEIDSAKIIQSLHVNGPFNVQFLVSDGKPYVIECNLRASRSFPFVSKAMKQNFITIASEIALGNTVKPVKKINMPYIAVKVPQFSFKRLRGADPVLRVEMSSTGEVAAFGDNLQEAYLKALFATGAGYPKEKSVFLSLGGDVGKRNFLSSAKRLADMQYTVYATQGTHQFLKEHAIVSQHVGKLHEHIHPNYTDLLKKGQLGFAVVLPERFTDTTKSRVVRGQSDGYFLRRASIDMGIPIFTNAESATLFIRSIQRYGIGDLHVLAWDEYEK